MVLKKSDGGLAALLQRLPRGLMLVAMPPIEVEVIDDTKSHGRGVDGAGCSDRRVPVLKLHIPFNCQIMG